MNESLPITMEVKKGDTFLIQIRIEKDMDLINDGSNLLKSLYQEKVLGDEFVVINVHFYKSLEDYQKQLIEKMNQVILNTINEL
jgi:hypothetical protein